VSPATLFDIGALRADDPAVLGDHALQHAGVAAVLDQGLAGYPDADR
jgi:hypothetical protein